MDWSKYLISGPAKEVPKNVSILILKGVLSAEVSANHAACLDDVVLDRITLANEYSRNGNSPTTLFLVFYEMYR